MARKSPRSSPQVDESLPKKPLTYFEEYEREQEAVPIDSKPTTPIQKMNDHRETEISLYSTHKEMYIPGWDDIQGPNQRRNKLIRREVIGTQVVPRGGKGMMKRRNK